MKTNRTTTLLALLVGASLLSPSTARAADAMPAMTATTPAAFDLAKAQAAYPLDTCVVSDDKLEGGMGGPIDYIHKEAGQPDRLVRFCCKSCIKDFKKDPAKYLKKIDASAIAKPGQAAQKP